MIIDDTESVTRKYWIAQNPRYGVTMYDPDFIAEQETKSIPAGLKEDSYRIYLPKEPSHPRAFVPYDVRFAKRKDQQFRCAITGWHEQDWIRDKQHQGPIRLVGVLTIEHVVAGSPTADDTIKMACGFVNGKKGDRRVSYEKIREYALDAYELVEPPADFLEMLTKYRVREFKI
jgi:hypothetical protein